MGQLAFGKGVVVIAVIPDLGRLRPLRLGEGHARVAHDLLQRRLVIPPRGQLIPSDPAGGASSASRVGG